tara:strand:- start:1475 stop:1957 length:483 start_codon:yes stop_codon:yes gene_type:complete
VDLVVIAQIITGTATLIVALVLVYQLRQQHRDSDRELSMKSMELVQKQMFIGLDNQDFRKILTKRKNGLMSFTDDEKELVFNYNNMIIVRINTEWRLGRLSGNKIYFKNNYRTLLSTKADLEYFKEFGRDYIKRTNAGNSNLLAIADEVYEELTGEKIGD